MDVAIIGAGEIGGSIAQALAYREVASTIRLIDDEGRVAEGKALDIMQSAPIEGFGATVSGSTDLASAAGTALVLVADRAVGGEWQDDAGLMLLDRLARVDRLGVVVCVGASQRLLVERGVREIRFPRERLFGCAPEALAAAIRALVAVETGGSPRDVALTVLGVPPAHIVVPWQEAAIGGLGATSMLDEPTRRRLAARVASLWPPGPRALAVAAAKTAEAVLERSRHTVAAFVAPDDSTGRRARAAALPVLVGAGGIVKIEVPVLSTRDQVALDNAMLL